MKHFVDIQVLREFDEVISDEIVKYNNCSSFQVGDMISITEKFDGSNASIALEDGVIKAFSRKQELSFANTLNGFWKYATSFTPEQLFDEGEENFIVFGEWATKNKIIYNGDSMQKWYVYSIFDKVAEQWLDRDVVLAYCEKHNLTPIHEFYFGPFVSWDHCRSFMNQPQYGERQEGVVVRNFDAKHRNEDKSDTERSRAPHILKLVNDSFKETMKVRQRVVDPEKEAEKERATELMESVVTEARVTKMLLKLRDEGVLPEAIAPEQLGLVAKVLPKRVYEDCLKEEPEIVMAAGEKSGKICNSIVMKTIRKIMGY